MLGSVSINILILLFATTVLVATTKRYGVPVRSTRERPERTSRPSVAGDLARGFFAAAGIVGLLVVVRRAFPELARTSGQHVTWIVAIVFTEEIVKLALTHRLRSTRPTAGRVRRAIVRGWGFAAAENVLYVMLLPSRFILRLILAGTVHLGTVVLYTAPQRPSRSPTAVNATRLVVAIVAHTIFNLIVVSLDAIPLF